jgi:hypothetical protein
MGVKLSLAGRGNRFEELSSYNNGKAGLYSIGTSQVLISRSQFIANGSTAAIDGGIVLTHGSGHRVIASTSAMNVGSGLKFYQNDTNSASFPFADGFGNEGAPTQAVVHNFVSYLNTHKGIENEFSGSTPAYIDRNYYSHLVVTGNSTNMDYSGATSGNASTFGGGGFYAANAAETFPAGVSSAIVLSSAQAALGEASFVGPVANDTTSSIGPSGTATFASFTLPEHWLARDSFPRVWQRDWTATPPSISLSGPCIGGNCDLVDWSLKLSDSVLKNRTGVGAGQSITGYTAPSSGAACPSEISGTEVLQTSTITGCSDSSYTTESACTGASKIWYPTQTFLKNAVEIIDSTNAQNDHDGLCESNETCLYTPNFGAYQGHGSLQTCTFSGTVSSTTIGGVTVYFYGTNGR